MRKFIYFLIISIIACNGFTDTSSNIPCANSIDSDVSISRKSTYNPESVKKIIQDSGRFCIDGTVMTNSDHVENFFKNLNQKKVRILKNKYNANSYKELYSQ